MCSVREQREGCSHQAGSGLEDQPISNPTVVLTPDAEPQPHRSRRQSKRRVRMNPPDPALASQEERGSGLLAVPDPEKN